MKSDVIVEKIVKVFPQLILRNQKSVFIRVCCLIYLKKKFLDNVFLHFWTSKLIETLRVLFLLIELNEMSWLLACTHSFPAHKRGEHFFYMCSFLRGQKSHLQVEPQIFAWNARSRVRSPRGWFAFHVFNPMVMICTMQMCQFWYLLHTNCVRCGRSCMIEPWNLWQNFHCCLNLELSPSEI